VSLRAVVGSVLVAGAAAVSADLVQAVVVVVVVVTCALDLVLVLLNLTVLILSTLVGPVHTCLHISKVASAGAHEVGRGHGLDFDEVGQLTDAGGVLTTLHAGVVTIMFMVGPVVGGVLDLHSPGGAVPQGVGGGLLAFVFRFAVDDSVAVTVARARPDVKVAASPVRAGQTPNPARARATAWPVHWPPSGSDGAQ